MNVSHRKHADYTYQSADDSLRVRVHRRENGRWDYDVFYPNHNIVTYSAEAGDDFRTKRAAILEAARQHGTLYSVSLEGSVVDKTWYAKHAARKFP